MYLISIFIVVILFYLYKIKESFSLKKAPKKSKQKKSNKKVNFKKIIFTSLQNVRSKIKKENDIKEALKKAALNKEKDRIAKEKERLRRIAESLFNKERSRISNEERQGILTSYLNIDL